MTLKEAEGVENEEIGEAKVSNSFTEMFADWCSLQKLLDQWCHTSCNEVSSQSHYLVIKTSSAYRSKDSCPSTTWRALSSETAVSCTSKTLLIFEPCRELTKEWYRQTRAIVNYCVVTHSLHALQHSSNKTVPPQLTAWLADSLVHSQVTSFAGGISNVNVSNTTVTAKKSCFCNQSLKSQIVLCWMTYMQHGRQCLWNVHACKIPFFSPIFLILSYTQ